MISMKPFTTINNMSKHYLMLGGMMILHAIYTSCFAQNPCGAASIDSAEYKYAIGRFDECIAGLNKCLYNKHSFNSDQKVQAYHLLAKCYLATDSANKAD